MVTIYAMAKSKMAAIGYGENLTFLFLRIYIRVIYLIRLFLSVEFISDIILSIQNPFDLERSRPRSFGWPTTLAVTIASLLIDTGLILLIQLILTCRINFWYIIMDKNNIDLEMSRSMPFFNNYLLYFHLFLLGVENNKIHMKN
jgi:hypothetical protein